MDGGANEPNIGFCLLRAPVSFRVIAPQAEIEAAFEAGDFAKAVGLEMDGAPIGFGIRSKRYAMLLDNGVVKALHVEDKPGSAVESSAERLLRDL